jgi:hypothetical protein
VLSISSILLKISSFVTVHLGNAGYQLIGEFSDSGFSIRLTRYALRF